jgi:hypothetical protein
MCFLEFFAANIRNPHTRRAYYRAVEEFRPGALALVDIDRRTGTPESRPSAPFAVATG